MKINHIEAIGLHLVNAFNRLTARKGVTVSLSPVRGAQRAAAVAKYLSEHAAELRKGWEAADAQGLAVVASQMQAGAAASEAMSNLLLAAVTGDKERFKAVFNEFVNEAVDTGVVTV